MKDIDWYIESESLSETLTCKILLIEDKEPMEQNTKRPRVVGSTFVRTSSQEDRAAAQERSPARFSFANAPSRTSPTVAQT